MNEFDKTKLIMPVIVLTAASLSVVIMFLNGYDFYKMLWILFFVIIIFYVIGDAIQYVYKKIKPRIIPEAEQIEKLLGEVDPTKLQLDEELLAQYVGEDTDENEEGEPLDSLDSIDLPSDEGEDAGDESEEKEEDPWADDDSSESLE